MGTFLSENLSTIIVGLAVLGIVVFALVRAILNARRGGCGCGCRDCTKKPD